MDSISSSFLEKRTPLTEDMRKEIEKIIGEAVQAKELRYLGGEVEPVKIFISWCESNTKNPYMIEELVDPFLTELSFIVRFYKKDIGFGRPTEQIYGIMDNCDVIIAFYTKDEETAEGSFRPSGNVVREISRDRPLKKVIFCEVGVKIETMTFSDIPIISFTREHYDKLLIDLLRFLKRNNLITTNTY